MNKYIHNIIIFAIILFFIWITFYVFNVQESFKLSAFFSENRITNKQRQDYLNNIAITNDSEYIKNEKGMPVYIQFTTEPYGKASSSVNVGLVKDEDVSRNIPHVRKIENIKYIVKSNIVGMKVPQGYKVTIHAGKNNMGISNTITGEKIVDDLKNASTLFDNEEEDDENGNPKVWNIGKFPPKYGWDERVDSITIHRHIDIPEEFDGIFYTKYVNFYDSLINIELQKPDDQRNIDSIADRAREMQWQHFVDEGELAGHEIYEGSGPYRIPENALASGNMGNFGDEGGNEISEFDNIDFSF